MSGLSQVALSLTMIAAVLLLIFGVKQAVKRETRQRGLLMIACGVVFVGNVLIWTLPTA